MFIGGKSADQNGLRVLTALRRVLREGDGSNSFAVFTADPEINYFVQVLGRRNRKDLFAESVSNRYLQPEYTLDSGQIQRLRNLGWNEPNGAEHPNFWRWWTAASDADLQRIARHLMRTLIEVYGFRLDRSLDVQLELSTGYK